MTDRPAPLPPTRWEAVDLFLGRLVPFIGLAVSIVLTVTLARTDLARAWPVVAVVTVWMLSGTLAPAWAVRARWAASTYYLGLLGLTLVLCLLAPWFGFLCAAGYAGAGEFLVGRWRLAGAGATAVIASVSQGGGLDGIVRHGPGLAALMLFVNLPIAGGLAVLGMESKDTARRQKRHIHELTEAYARLERLTAENAGLQAQLLRQAREAGTMDERARLAREIHDTLAQGLTGIIAQLQAVLGPPGPGGLSEPGTRAEHDRHLRIALDLARESLAEARRSVRAMAPVPLEGGTLVGALEGTARAWSARSGVPADVRVSGEPVALHGELEAALLRTAQEALANVAKHARASRVAVTLSYLGSEVALDVLDDGVGFVSAGPPGEAGPPAAGTGSGFGLRSMRQRVQRLAGSLDIDSEPGGGTAVSARVPAIGA